MLTRENAREKLVNFTLFRKISDVRTTRRFIRYLIIGFSSFGLEYSIFFFLYRINGSGYITANSSAITLIFWFNFLMNRYWTFRSRQAFIKQIPLYTLIFFFNIAISNLLMFVGSNLIGIAPLFSKILAMGFIAMWTFLIYTKLVYRY